MVAKTSKFTTAWSELEQYATGHEMSNQQSDKPDLPQHKTESPWKNSWPPTTSQRDFFALHDVHLEPFETLLAGSPKVVILAQLRLL